MKPAIYLHGLKTLELSPVEHYPKNDSSKEFWTRILRCTDALGDHYSLSLFSCESAEALTLKCEEIITPTPKKDS